jgi:hypothetical protein
MAGSSGQQTTTTRSDPWSGQQPYLQDIMGQGQQLYNAGVGSEYFPGSTVVPFSPDTQAGMSGIRNTATQPAFGAEQGQGLLSQIMGGGQQNRNDVLNSAASGEMVNPVTQQLQGAAGQNTTAGVDTLQQTASGGMLGSNPHLDAMFNRAAGKVADTTNAQFSLGGRYGSGAHTGALADSLGGLASNIYGQNYESERGRQLGAAGQLGAFQQGDLSRQGGLLSQLGAFGESGMNRRLGAASDINSYGLAQGQQGLGALGMLPGLREYGQSGARDLMGLGQIQEGQGRAELQDLMDRWNFSQQNPWDQLGRYSGIVGGLGSLGGSTTTTGPRAPSGGLMGALGGGAAGAGIGSALDATGPVGWGLAGLGGLMGLFG